MYDNLELYSNSKFCYNDKRFDKISQKISEIQNFELKSTDKISKVESKLDYLETNILKKIKDFEFKQKFLQDEMTVLNKMLDDNKEFKEGLKSKINLEIKNLELKMKTLFEAERENRKIFVNSIQKTMEHEIFKMESEIQKEKEAIILLVQNIKTVVDIDIPKLNENFEESTEETQNQIKEISMSLNEELKYLYSLV
jgi:hypothetical protein